MENLLLWQSLKGVPRKHQIRLGRCMENSKLTFFVLTDKCGVSDQVRKGTKNRKGSRHLQKTPLATRSVEERERLISEKVAVMLTSADNTKVGWTNGGTPKQSRRLACLVNKVKL